MFRSSVVVFVHLQGGHDPVGRHHAWEVLAHQGNDQIVDGVEAASGLPAGPLESPQVSGLHLVGSVAHRAGIPAIAGQEKPLLVSVASLTISEESSNLEHSRWK